jgi:hypothetical protein
MRLPPELLNAYVTFGLSAEKRARVRDMLESGADWPTIGKDVGWDPATLREYYEDKPPPMSTPVSSLYPWPDKGGPFVYWVIADGRAVTGSLDSEAEALSIAALRCGVAHRTQYRADAIHGRGGEIFKDGEWRRNAV